MLVPARSWLIVSLLLWLAGISPVYGGEPLELVKLAADKVIALLRGPQLKAVARGQERVEQLKAIINAIFDYDEIARRTLAADWELRTPAEREEFTKLLRAFLEKVYSERIHLDDGERLVFGRESIYQDYAEVESKLINHKNEESLLI